MLNNMLDFESCPVLEISGESNTGKTLLEMELITEILLPEKYGGKNWEVIFIDTKTNLNYNKLQKIMMWMKNKIRVNSSNISEEEIEKIAEEVLGKLTILNCSESEQFFYLPHSLKMELEEQGNRSRVIVLDNLTTFYWHYCASEDKTRMITYMKNVFVQFLEVCNASPGQNKFIFARSAHCDTFIDKTSIKQRVCLKREMVDKFNVFSCTFSRDLKLDAKKYCIKDSGFVWLD